MKFGVLFITIVTEHLTVGFIYFQNTWHIPVIVTTIGTAVMIALIIGGLFIIDRRIITLNTK